MYRPAQLIALICLIFVLGDSLVRAQTTPPPELGVTVWPDPDHAIADAPKFIVALHTAPDGDLYAGTEDDGVCRFSPATNTWTRYTTKDGLGDNSAYAVTCDDAGRVWVGHLNHGVSVFNGTTWKNYDLLTGPLGSRVFAIVASPIAREIWIATDAGIARYSLKSENALRGNPTYAILAQPPTNPWSYLTRADGLASDQINAIAFDRDGTVYVGTQCDGIDIGSSADDYKTWRHVRGVKDMPGHASGKGLPTNLINALVVAPDGRVYAGTTRGLATSADRGATWSYIRGKDWKDKAINSYEGAHPDFNPAEVAPLAEDYITALRLDSRGRLWIGHRASGYEIFDPFPARVIVSYPGDTPGGAPAPAVADRYVTAFAAVNGNSYVAHYGAGLTRVEAEAAPNFVLPHALQADSALPPPAEVPRPSQVMAMIHDLRARPTTHIVAAFLGDDWRTGGDWVGRYGAQYATLCGVGLDTRSFAPGNARDFMSVDTAAGPHFPGAEVYTYTTSMGEANRKILYDPVTYKRVQAEVNDGSFSLPTFPYAAEGPDIWVRIHVPQGVHRVSLYFYNVDGHTGENPYRDFLLELKRIPLDDKQDNARNGRPDNETLFKLEDAPTLASARVTNFWGPVYKQFIVGEEGTFWIKIARNHSFCTKLSGVFIDRLAGPAMAQEDQARPWMDTIKYDPPERPTPGGGADPLQGLILRPWQLWDVTDQSWMSFGVQDVAWRNKLLAYRAALGSGADESVLKYCQWHLALWSDSDREAFDKFVVNAPQKPR